MHKIFIVMGKSASGKDTLFGKIINNEELCLQKIVPYTTRPIRSGETNGIEYYFTDECQLKGYEATGTVIEHRTYKTVYGIWHYYTVDDGQIDLTKSDYITIGTLDVYKKFNEYFGSSNIVPIYIFVEDGLRLDRALSRERGQINPKYSELCRRYLADEKDFSEAKLTSLGISKKYNNFDMNICLNQIIDDIKKYRTY